MTGWKILSAAELPAGGETLSLLSLPQSAAGRYLFCGTFLRVAPSRR
jgi:hypothetical protein